MYSTHYSFERHQQTLTDLTSMQQYSERKAHSKAVLMRKAIEDGPQPPCLVLGNTGLEKCKEPVKKPK